MDSSMHVCSRRKFLRFAVASLALTVAAIPASRAEGIQAQQIDVVQKGELFHLNGGFAIQLSPTLDDALRRGVQLTFVQAVEAERARDWWLAEGLSDLERRVRLSTTRCCASITSASAAFPAPTKALPMPCARPAICATGP